jgi:two-component system, NtrC family, nitrogen regulation sensor histidine kinase NtrY
MAVTALPGDRRLAIGVDFRRSESVNQMFETALTEFDRLKQQQATVRQIGFLTLGVLTFLLIFASSWTAFYIARGLTGPIKALAEGAERIAQGELGHRVDVLAEDELALLVSTFNEMSTKLEANAAEITERRRYIETVLLSLPTGVISIDSRQRISTINPAAKSILRLELDDFRGRELETIIDPADRATIDRLMSRAQRVGRASDNVRLTLPSDEGDEGLPVSVTATALPEDGGVVLVIEDLSELIAAQRASAWQEVARRMAHEIKNPLTPIQLSAERIARRFAGHPAASGVAGGSVSEEGNARVVQDGTNIILREVQSLKAMVDEFSRFARLPNVSLELWDLNEVIRETKALYSGRTDEILIQTELGENLPPAMIDDEQLKRVFVNLIDNAIEAPGRESKTIRIVSRLDGARDLIVVEVSDNGNGIEPANQPKLFQPYFSTKGRGTGLGLAIVHRIIAEHKGKIKAVPNQPRGARFIIELPIPTRN